VPVPAVKEAGGEQGLTTGCKRPGNGGRRCEREHNRMESNGNSMSITLKSLEAVFFYEAVDVRRQGDMFLGICFARHKDPFHGRPPIFHLPSPELLARTQTVSFRP